MVKKKTPETSNKTKKKYFYFFIKRLLDIVFGLIGSIILIPILIIIKIASMLTGDFHSIFYTHERIGKNGKPFKMFKLRSMVVNADEVLKDVLKDKKLKKQWDKYKKLDNDPRLTKVGKFIRRYSIDEMPQFFNVLLGNMSLIGNRPYLPREKDDMGKYFDDIVKTKPGLTGLWQVSGRSNVAFDKRLQIESYYSLVCSLKVDIMIFFKTFKVVFFGRGAK